MNKFLLELIQITFDNRKALTRQLTIDEWRILFADCKKHFVLVPAFAGVHKLPMVQMPPAQLLETWKSEIQTAKDRSSLLNHRCKDVCDYFDSQGFCSCVLMPLKNTCMSWDINILGWTKEKKDGVHNLVEYVNFKYVSSTHHIKPKVQRQHMDWKTGSFPVDVRFKFSYFNSPLHDRRFLAWVEEKTFSVSPQKGECGYPVPSDTFNAVYQLIHLYRKLFCEGLRLGHLYDYYMVLRSLPKSEHEEVMRVIGRLGMKKFAGAVMHVMQTVFGMPDEYLFCKPIARNGSFVISITMQAGEYTRAIERTRMLKHLGRIGHHLYWLKRNRPFLTQYPAEVCFELYRRIRG